MSYDDSSSEDDIARLKALQSNTPIVSHTLSDLNTVVLKNLQPNITSQEIITFFISCGKIKNICIPKCQKGTAINAYVEFVGKKEFDLGLSLNGTVLNGRIVYVFAKKSVGQRKN